MRIGQLTAYSQNFIKSAELVDRLIQLSNIKNTDTVIEIGPGEGIITKSLAKKVGRLTAVEIDKKLSAKLTEQISQEKSVNNPQNNTSIYNCDFLDYPLPLTEYKVFSNIPFNYTARIIKKLFMSDENSPSEAYLVVQKEVYEKYKGYPRETQMSLLFKPLFDIQHLYGFHRTDFEPKANVDTVFIQILKRDNPLISQPNYHEYKDFVVYSSSQWKPNIKLALKKIFTYKQLKRLAKDMQFSLEMKPLDLQFDQWLKLFDFYQNNVIDEKKAIVRGSFLRQLTEQKKIEKKMPEGILK